MRRPDGKLTHEMFEDDKGPQDACGIFGVWAPGEEVAKLTFYGLYALQHRGQESAGIATSDGERILIYKDIQPCILRGSKCYISYNKFSTRF